MYINLGDPTNCKTNILRIFSRQLNNSVQSFSRIKFCFYKVKDRHTLKTFTCPSPFLHVPTFGNSNAIAETPHEKPKSQTVFSAVYYYLFFSFLLLSLFFNLMQFYRLNVSFFYLACYQ